MVSVPTETLEPLSALLLVVAIALSLVLLRGRTSRGRLLDPVRERFVLGVPWGTAIAVGCVLAVYYLLQGGGRPGGPVVVSYRSWSYTYPLGMVTAPFAHASDGHLTGNLLSTLAFAPVAEYAWSHYPTRRGSHSFADWRTNPFVRIALFVAGVFLVGLATSLLTPGALIGFSGVVFAFGGFAVVTRPLTAVAAVLAGQIIALTYYAVLNPIRIARASQQYVVPGWANIAVQGHALGLLVGMLAGFALVRRRDAWPGFRRVWFATLAFTVANSLYALYWYLSGSEFVLFRGLGTAALFVLAGTTALALASTDRSLLDRIDLTRREAAVGVLACVVLAIGAVAVPYNLVTVEPGPAAEGGVEVRDYTVTYAEDVPNQYIAAVEIPVLRDSLTVETSGVIVTSPERSAWEVVVPTGRLAAGGYARVSLGGPGWRETVAVTRRGWTTLGGNTTYTVFAEADGRRERVFTADPATASPVLNGSRVTVAPAADGFRIRVARNGSVVGRAPMPRGGEAVTVAGIGFARDGRVLVARADGTRLRIATRNG